MRADRSSSAISGPVRPTASNPRTSSRRLSTSAWTSWRASRSPDSVKNEHGLALEPPGQQILGDLADLLPRPLQADVRHELTGATSSASRRKPTDAGSLPNSVKA